MQNEQYPKLEALAEELVEIVDMLTAIRARHYSATYGVASTLVYVAPLAREMLEQCPSIVSILDKEKSVAFDEFVSLYDRIRKLKEAICVEEDVE